MALTEKQKQVLEYIERIMERTGRAPTYRKIAEHFEFKAIGTVQDYIAKLVDLGYLEKNKHLGLQLPIQDQVTWVPILGKVPAGDPIEARQENQGSIALTGNWSGHFFALQVKGESMKDRGILNGDVVIVRQQIDAENGEIVVAQIDQEATVKILEKKRGTIRLLPANSAFQPIEMHPDRDNKIVGRVVGVHRVY